MSAHLLLAGGGHAHLTVLKRLDELTGRGHRVTLVSPSPFHYYSGMGPGMLGSVYTPAEVRFHIARMTTERGGEFVEGIISRIDGPRQEVTFADGRTLHYDVLSCNTGSGIAEAVDTAPRDESIYPVKPIDNLVRLRQRIERDGVGRTWRFVVAGGGPAGVEVAGNLLRKAQRSGGSADITLVSGGKLLSDFPAKVRDLARNALTGRGIRVVEGVRAARLAAGQALLENGQEIPFDAACIAVGVRPSPLFADSDLPTGPDGGLLVDASLRSVAHPNIFGGGDCISFRDRLLDKVGVYAVRQNPILLHNLLAALEGRPLTTFDPQRDYLLIFNLGDGTGLLHWRGLSWRGRPAFWLKNAIDRRFMRSYQVSGETDT